MATYIKFGENEVDYDQLMLNAANEVYNFVKRLPWSNKRKESFMRAYSDIASRGITSAGIGENGLWNINYNGEDLSAESEMDKQMQGAAADFFINQMRRLPTKASLEEDAKKKKEDLPIFNNSYFTQLFHGKIETDWFGGIDWKQSEWNDFDKRGENGLRGTTERAKRLANTLENYSASLKEGEHNFEGSPFADLNDFKTRVNNVVSVLRNGTPDQYKDALYSIGLRYDDYFNDGSGDVYTTDELGNPITYGAYYDAQAKLAEDEKKRKLALELAALNDKRGVLSVVSGIHGVEARNNRDLYHQWLGQTYGTGTAGYNKINDRILTLINKGNSLTQAEKKELGNFLYYIRQNNPGYLNSGVSDLEYEELMRHNSLKGKKQSDFIRFPWKTLGGLDVYGDDKGNLYYLKNDRQNSNGIIPNTRLNLNREAVNKYRQNFLRDTRAGIDDAQKEFLGSIGFNDADKAELGGILLDIASIVDPEPWTAGIMGVGAAGARNYARLQDPKDWSLGDYFWQSVDYLTGAAGAIPLIGDSALAYKTIKGIAKIGKRMLTIPAVYEMLSESPGAYNTIQKAIKGEDLTVEDYRHFGLFIRGLTATRNITVLNRAARRALEKRGYDLSSLNSFIKRSGLWDTSVPTSQTTLKINVKGETKEIPISPLSKEKLDPKLKKSGNDLAKKDIDVREVPEVKEYISKNNLKPEDITAHVSESLRNARAFKGRVGIFPSRFRTTNANYGTTSLEKPTNNDTFESYLSSDRGLWDRIKYGSNRTLRRMDKLNGVTSSNTTSNAEASTSNPKKKLADIEAGESKWKRSDDAKLYRDVLSGSFGKEKIKSGKYKIGDVEFNVELNTGQTSSGILLYPGNSGMSFFRFKNQKELLKKVAEILKEQRVKTTSSGKVKVDVKKMGEVIRDFKAKGLLKQGGTINNNKIKKYKNFINK